MASARQTALMALVRVERDGAYSALALRELLERSALPPRDAAFSTAVFYGVTERRLTLDYMLARHSKTPLRKLDAVVRAVLRMGAYQLAYMDTVPDSAAVNESVALCKKNKKTSAAGFVNAVLRALIREGKTPVFTGEEDDPARMSVEFSCPRALVELFCGRFGARRTRAILACSVGASPLYARTNTLKTTPEELVQTLARAGVTAKPHEDISGCLSLYHTGDLAKLTAFADGLFHIQDASSQLCALAVDARPGMTVLDLCAAPGGKSFTMAQTMRNTGRLLAFDLYEFKAGLIREGAARLGLTALTAATGDAGVFNPELPPADRVLCDAPCSGFGVMRRKPEIRYKSLDGFAELERTQAALLANAARYVKPGGELVYSTCTLREQENEAVADAFLQTHSEYSPRPLRGALTRCLQKAPHMATVLPDDFNSDGFFVAAFVKTGD